MFDLPKSFFKYTLVDLTHELSPTSPAWDLSCTFNCATVLDYDACTTQTHFRMQHIAMPAGIGTHMDAPAHCFKNEKTIDQFQLEQLLAPCIVINVAHKAHADYIVSIDDIALFEKTYGTIQSDTFVFMYTDWDKYWDNPKKYHNHFQFPYVSKDAAELLLQRNVAGLGIDTLSSDRPGSLFPVHELFLGNGKYLIENCAHLQLLAPIGNFCLVAPLKAKYLTEAPIRLIGFIEKQII